MVLHLEVIAFFAGLISSTAAVPQIYRMIKTRKTGAVSTFMFAMKNVSNTLWVAFGFATGVWAVVFWNIVSFGLCTTVIVMKHKIVKQKEAEIAAKAEAEKIVKYDINKVVDNTIPVQELEYHIPKRPALRLVYSASSQA